MTKPLAKDEMWVWNCCPRNEEDAELAAYCDFHDPHYGGSCSKCPNGMRTRVKKDDPRYVDELLFADWE